MLSADLDGLTIWQLSEALLSKLEKKILKCGFADKHILTAIKKITMKKFKKMQQKNSSSRIG